MRAQEGELVYDFAWFSRMAASDPATCCFVTTSRVRGATCDSPCSVKQQHQHRLWAASRRQLTASTRASQRMQTLCMHSQAHPVHLWDAVTGELRCSYLGFDDKDEVTAAFSVAFSADGSQVCEGAAWGTGGCSVG